MASESNVDGGPLDVFPGVVFRNDLRLLETVIFVCEEAALYRFFGMVQISSVSFLPLSLWIS
jgi:hypothetical protein